MLPPYLDRIGQRDELIACEESEEKIQKILHLTHVRSTESVDHNGLFAWSFNDVRTQGRSYKFHLCLEQPRSVNDDEMH